VPCQYYSKLTGHLYSIFIVSVLLISKAPSMACSAIPCGNTFIHIIMWTHGHRASSHFGRHSHFSSCEGHGCLVKQHSCYSRQAYCDADDDGCLTSNNKGSLYSITERRVPDLIPVLGNQPAGDTHTHTRLTALFLGLPTQVSRYQKGKTDLDFTEARDSE